MEGDENVKNHGLFSEEIIQQARKKIADSGIRFGKCDHCGKPAYLNEHSCTCGRKNGKLFRKRVCVKNVCGSCALYYPLKNFRAILRDAEKECYDWRRVFE